MGDAGGRDDKWSHLVRRYERVRLKLYKKPKPGRTGTSPQEDPVSQLGDTRGGGGDAGHSAAKAAAFGGKGTTMALAGAAAVLVAVLIYVFYTPSPPPLGSAIDAAALVPLCQQGNGTACAMTALLRWEGKERPDAKEGGEPDKNAAFAYARVACKKDSPFGCFLVWYLWATKATLIVRPPEAEAALRKGCEEERPVCCHLVARFARRTEVSDEERRDAFESFRSGKEKRYAAREEEQRLFERFAGSL